MLARQSAPLPRQFCKVSACFIFNSQCGPAVYALASQLRGREALADNTSEKAIKWAR